MRRFRTVGPDPDIYNVKLGFERLDAAGQRLRDSVDLELLRHARRALLPLPLIDRPQRFSSEVFPPFRRRSARALAGKRVAVVASGGAGAAVALIGAARAFEEADLQPELISGCSGGGMFGALWAAGLSAQEMADFVLRGSRSGTSIPSGCACRASRLRRCVASRAR